jgi:hypothetical protein
VVPSNAISRQPLVIAVMAGTDGANIEGDYPTNVRDTAAEIRPAAGYVFLAFQLRSLYHSRFTGAAVGSQFWSASR